MRDMGLARRGALFLVLVLALLFASLPTQSQETAEPQPQDHDVGNLIFNGSLEDFNGQRQLLGWYKGGFGDNDAELYLIEGTGGASTVAARVYMTRRRTGDRKWFHDPVPVVPGRTYHFTHQYRASIPTRIAVRLTDEHGGNAVHPQIAVLAPAAEWQKTTAAFKVPEGKTRATIFHVIEDEGVLDVDDYVLRLANFRRGRVTFRLDDAWLSQYKHARPVLNDLELRASFAVIANYLGRPDRMTAKHVRKLFKQKHHIANHSLNHRALVRDVPRNQWDEEIFGAKLALEQVIRKEGAVNVFVYPFGDFNDETNEVVRASGHEGAGISERGFNHRGADPFKLKVQAIDHGPNRERVVTADTVKAWIDQAEAEGLWLILLFHQVDDGVVAQFSITTGEFEAIARYVADRRVDVVTLGEGLEDLFMK